MEQAAGATASAALNLIFPILGRVENMKHVDGVVSNRINGYVTAPARPALDYYIGQVGTMLDSPSKIMSGG